MITHLFFYFVFILFCRVYSIIVTVFIIRKVCFNCCDIKPHSFKFKNLSELCNNFILAEYDYMRNLYKTKLLIPSMISNRVKIGAVLAVAVVFVGYCAYASQHAFDLKGEPESYPYQMNVGESTLETTLETYSGGDPARMIQYTLINPQVKRVYVLFKASEDETDNPHLVKAAASVGEGLGAAIGKKEVNMDPEDVIPREITWFQRVLIFSGVMGTEIEPVVYFKTPNVGGTQDRIIVGEGIIIIESSTYQNAYYLASFVRQMVMQ